MPKKKACNVDVLWQLKKNGSSADVHVQFY